MTELKRKSISDDLSEIEIKKFRNEFNPTINCFENLSNDLLCEIFDYFDGYTLHEIFSNLNYRFEELLHSSCVLFKTYCVLFNCKEILNIFKQQVFNNRSQIFSLHINFILENTDFFTSFIFDSSFHRLESIVFENIKFNTIIPIVNNLFSLPCLFSLTIETSNITKEINDIYQLIFTLPKLKYYRINSLNEYHHHHHPLILLSMPINNQFSSIQYLIINHYCSLNELTYFISYTPQLRRLTVHKMKTNNDTTIPLLPLITLVHLKSLYLDLHKIKFNEMEIFFQNIFLNLNILTIIGRDDTSFLDAYRWKQLILQSFPYLKQFYLFYDDYVDNEEKYPIYTGGLNQFSSSFWIEQKSMIDVEVKTGNIQYIIHPYKRKRWYHDIEDHILNYSIFNRLIFEYIPDDIYEHSVIEDIQRVLSITQIYHLEIHDEKLSISTLIHIINVLPDIITLKIHSLSIDETDELTAKDVIILCSMKERQNKIIKIYLEEINDDQELNFLFTLCPYVEYLKIESIKTMNIDLFLRKFFKRINLDKNSYLHSLCFNLSSENDQIIEDIKQMITCEKLLNQFNIKRILNTVYLQWK